MRFGDLSNKAAPRIYIVWEKAIADVTPEDKPEFLELIAEGKYKEAVDLCIMNTFILNKIYYLSMRQNVNIYLVTWMGQGMAAAIEEYMNDIMSPVRGCISTTPVQLAKMTQQDDSVIGIYDPDPYHVLTYGSKGRVLNSERDLS